MQLDDRMKLYESVNTRDKSMPLLPLFARLDGKAFHSFTNGLSRPFDKGLSSLMIETTKHLVKTTNALVGYTQSDEITLLMYSNSMNTQLFFDGRLFKINSILAATASVFFNKNLEKLIPSHADKNPLFDCRCWNVPTLEEAVNVFVWRELDATKNSITMAAQSYYSHNELMNKNGSEKQEMLFKKGINWNDYPAFFKRGTYIKTRKVERPFTPEELDKLPLKHEARQNPSLKIVRSEICEMDLPPILSISNKTGVFFQDEEPIVNEA